MANLGAVVTVFGFLPDPGVSGVRSMGPDVHTGCLRKNALLGFLYPWDRLLPVVTIVLVKVVGEMLDDD